MYVCIYIYIYTCLYIHIHICTSIVYQITSHLYTSIYVCTSIVYDIMSNVQYNRRQSEGDDAPRCLICRLISYTTPYAVVLRSSRKVWVSRNQGMEIMHSIGLGRRGNTRVSRGWAMIKGCSRCSIGYYRGVPNLSLTLQRGACGSGVLPVRITNVRPSGPNPWNILQHSYHYLSTKGAQATRPLEQILCVKLL